MIGFEDGEPVSSSFRRVPSAYRPPLTSPSTRSTMSQAKEISLERKLSTDRPEDVEKDAVSITEFVHAQKDWHYSHKWTRTLLRWGLETRGA